jgi:hypothetical protein
VRKSLSAEPKVAQQRRGARRKGGSEKLAQQQVQNRRGWSSACLPAWRAALEKNAFLNLSLFCPHGSFRAAPGYTHTRSSAPAQQRGTPSNRPSELQRQELWFRPLHSRGVLPVIVRVNSRARKYGSGPTLLASGETKIFQPRSSSTELLPLTDQHPQLSPRGVESKRSPKEVQIGRGGQYPLCPAQNPQ